MHNYDTSMPEFSLVDSLGVDEGLAKEGSHRRGLIEAYNTIICSHLLECT
jgi:hypothetical protein